MTMTTNNTKNLTQSQPNKVSPAQSVSPSQDKPWRDHNQTKVNPVTGETTPQSVEQVQDPLSFLQSINAELKNSQPATQPTVTQKIDNYIKKLGSGQVHSHRVTTDEHGRSHAVPNDPSVVTK